MGWTAKAIGAGDEVIMNIAGHVSRAISRATPTCGWRRSGTPPDEIATRQRAADEKRKEEAAERRQQQAAVSAQSAVVQ